MILCHGSQSTALNHFQMNTQISHDTDSGLCFVSSSYSSHNLPHHVHNIKYHLEYSEGFDYTDEATTASRSTVWRITLQVARLPRCYKCTFTHAYSKDMHEVGWTAGQNILLWYWTESVLILEHTDSSFLTLLAVHLQNPRTHSHPTHPPHTLRLMPLR